MKKHRMAAILAALLCLGALGPASAGSASLNGTVVSLHTEVITSPLGGVIGEVLVTAGDHVSKGDTLIRLETEKVYAQQSGTVRLFGEAGDSAEMIAARYGAVAYIEPEVEYTISASTKNAYDAEENRIIHPGETVYLSNGGIQSLGSGIVTAVSGTSFTVEVREGSFDNGASLYVFREKSCAAQSRLGRGSIARQDPVAYTGEGIVVNYPAAQGAKVEKGDVLFELLTGSFGGHTGTLTEVTAPGDGVVAAIDLSRGASLAAGDTVASFYADDDLRVQAGVSEEDLQSFHVGDTVSLSFTYLDEGEYTIDGVIEKIGRTSTSADADSNEASYAAIIRPETAERLHYGMNAVVEGK